MSSFTLVVESRNEAGKGPMRRLRASGFVPGVLYGKGTSATPLKIGEADLQKLLRGAGRTRLIKLESAVKDVNGKHALVREIQTNPVTDELLHIDLLGVDLSQRVVVTLPLDFVGVAAGEKAGGMRNIKRYNVTIECKAEALPEKVEVDVSGVEVGQGLSVGDLKLPEGVKARTNSRVALFIVEKMRKVEETPAAAAAAPAAGQKPAAAAAEPAKADAAKGGKK